jgi:hypothetical protein
MTISRFIIDTNLVNNEGFAIINRDAGVLTHVRGVSAWMDISIILLLPTK